MPQSTRPATVRLLPSGFSRPIGASPVGAPPDGAFSPSSHMTPSPTVSPIPPTSGAPPSITPHLPAPRLKLRCTSHRSSPPPPSSRPPAMPSHAAPSTVPPFVTIVPLATVPTRPHRLPFPSTSVSPSSRLPTNLRSIRLQISYIFGEKFFCFDFLDAGNVITVALFLSPVSVFIKICKKGSVEQFSSVLYLATLLHALNGIWAVLGDSNSIFFLTVDGMGITIELSRSKERLETIKVKSKVGIAKVLGMVVCVSGAMLLTLYKGVAFTNSSDTQLSASREQHNANAQRTGKWFIGSMTLLAGTMCWSMWFLLQSKVGKKYPAIYNITAIIFFLSFLQAAALCLATERSISLCVLRKMVMASTILRFLVLSWCVKKRGPVFAAAFTPFVQIMDAVIDSSILHEPLYLGSVLWSVLVIAGLYSLLWSKSKEARYCAVKPA